MDAAMQIFALRKAFPIEEKYSMVDQMRRSSRSVCANIAEAWRKRRHRAHFVSKLSDAASEAEETLVWLEFAHRCRYMSQIHTDSIDEVYDGIIGQAVNMSRNAEQWIIR